MTVKELAKLVADDFKNTMIEFEFDTFIEMKECYWWTSDDIKEEVIYLVNHAEAGYIADDDGDIHFYDANHIEKDYCTYRKFINMVYRVLKEEKIYA